MSDRSFTLHPFEPDPALGSFSLSGTLSRRQNQLTLRYHLRGEIAAIVLPSPTDQPQRQDHLWQTTCFECFWGLQGAPLYWELNLSPAGHWNLYRFEDYRTGMQVEQAIVELPIQTQITSDTFTLGLTLNLDAILPHPSGLDVGISTVLATTEQQLSYWALTHPANQPDFHQRAGFILNV